MPLLGNRLVQALLLVLQVLALARLELVWLVPAEAPGFPQHLLPHAQWVADCSQLQRR